VVNKNFVNNIYMKIRYIILFVTVMVVYVLLNSIEPFGNNMIGRDSNGADINISAICKDRTKDQCTTTHGCKWDVYKKAGKEIKECNLKKQLTSGYGKGGINVHIPVKCNMRNSQNCEATLGCSWGNNKKVCKITNGWEEGQNLEGKVVHFHKKCSQRELNYCMIGPNCYLNGGLCHNKSNTGKFERESCRIDRKNVTMAENVNMCRNVRQHWTPEHDKKDDVEIPIPIIRQTKTCWHCPKAI